MIDSLIDVITPWFAEWGILIIFAATFLESSVVIASFLPGESVLLLGGFLASPNSLVAVQPLTFEQVVFAALAGAVAGDVVGYVIGRLAGRAIVRRFGRFFFLPESRLPLLEQYFHTYGVRAVVLGRFAPFIRSVRTLVAGTARMGFMRFVIPDLLAASIWVVAIATAGYVLGESWDIAQRYLGAGGFVVFILIVLAFGVSWRRLNARIQRDMESVSRNATTPEEDGQG